MVIINDAADVCWHGKMYVNKYTNRHKQYAWYNAIL